jgi:ATP-dependent DNA ligase
MPLASSREAADRKRASNAPDSKTKRAKRLSLPSTIKSTTSVDVAKARRRQSLSRQNSSQSLQSKENHGPGPTPYYQVAEERGEMSPRQTRSAKKNRLPPMIQKVGGVQLNFSPPDQELIRRKELEKEEAR